ncbi:MAG: prephenate dehydratase domain-containing protein, partial [Promethearchaeia archaeon]
MPSQDKSEKKKLERELDELRRKIDSIDEKLLSFLNQRAEIVKGIGQIKQELGYNVFQPNREEKIINMLEEKSETLSHKSLKAIWKEIMAASKELQGHVIEVGYLGPKGTFTHQAALNYFPKANTEFVPCTNIAGIFSKIEKDILDFGAIPIENNMQGTVRETMDLLIEKELNIYGEIELRIVQNLISKQETKLSDVKKIYSHPQAFAQT